MKTKIKMIAVTFLSLFSLSATAVTDWNSSPSNWNNSASNWNNSSSNWNNSPSNWENSASKFGNDRIVRDNNGNPVGYAVPKDGGGVNIYNTAGERTGYVPDPQ